MKNFVSYLTINIARIFFVLILIENSYLFSRETDDSGDGGLVLDEFQREIITLKSLYEDPKYGGKYANWELKGRNKGDQVFDLITLGNLVAEKNLLTIDCAIRNQYFTETGRVSMPDADGHYLYEEEVALLTKWLIDQNFTWDDLNILIFRNTVDNLARLKKSLGKEGYHVAGVNGITLEEVVDNYINKRITQEKEIKSGFYSLMYERVGAGAHYTSMFIFVDEDPVTKQKDLHVGIVENQVRPGEYDWNERNRPVENIYIHDTGVKFSNAYVVSDNEGMNQSTVKDLYMEFDNQIEDASLKDQLVITGSEIKKTNTLIGHNPHNIKNIKIHYQTKNTNFYNLTEHDVIKRVCS